MTLPTVALTRPAAFEELTGSTNLGTVSWTYTPGSGGDQAKVRIQVLDGDTPELPVLYDTGLQAYGPQTIDLLYTMTSGANYYLRLTVQDVSDQSAEDVHKFSYSTTSTTFDPAVALTAPSGPLTTSTATFAWTYTPDGGLPQAAYRVQLLDQFAGVLYDSGEVAGTDVTFECPFLLSGGSLYTAKVIVRDEYFNYAEDTSAFSVDLVDVGDFPVSEAVGSTAEIGINGVGYLLADNPERPYRRATGQLQASRLATGETPFSEAIERYSFIGVGDWSRGAGQSNANREASDVRAFLTSEGVNPFEPGELTLLPATEELFTGTAGHAVVASQHLFCATSTTEVKRLTTPAGTPTTMTFPAALVDLASDGTHWYAATADAIRQGTDTTVGSAWSDLSTQTSDIKLIEWCSDRLGVVYVNGSGQYAVSTLGPNGAEEVAAGRFKHDDVTITGLASGDGYLWYSANRSDRAVIYAWQLGSDSSSFIALDLPAGESVSDLFFYLGNVMVRTDNGTVYRTIPNNGQLTPERVATGTGTGPFAGLDRFVLFGWTAMSDDGRSGVGAIDLSTGGWCRWLQAEASTDTGAVTDLFVWDGELGFSVAGSGPHYTTDVPVAAGYLITSVYDLASSLTKVFDQVSMSIAPLAADSSIELQVSTDGGSSFTSVGSISTAGVREGRWDIGRQGASVALRINMTATGLLSPSVSMIQLKLHPLSLVDQVVELPIACHSRINGLNGVEVQGALEGVAMARALEGLVGTRVLFQDVDWPITGLAEVWEVFSAEFTSVGVFERRRGHRRESQPVCLCTLRRSR